MPVPTLRCSKLTDAGLVPIARGCPRLSWLSVHGVLGVTDASVDALAEGCGGAPCLPARLRCMLLCALRLFMCDEPLLCCKMKKACTPPAPRTTGALHTLDVVGCTGVRGRDPAALRAKLPRLTCFLTHS